MATNIKNKESQKYNKALTLDDRILIDSLISKYRDASGNMTMSLNDIAANVEKDPTTISKELKKHRSPIVFKNHDYVYTSHYCNMR